MTAPSGMARLPSGETVPALGQGTWGMAEDRRRRSEEIASLGRGIDLGMTLIDTAEMYADGAAEELVGEAVAGRRDEVFLVSKVMPENAGRDGAVAACDASLRRLRTDRIDLYLLHWRGRIALEETLEAFARLQAAGKIRHWGVSNFDVDDMEDLAAAGGARPATNQILYNLTRRGVEFDLLPWCAGRGIPVMAYSPVEQGRLLVRPELRRLAAAEGIAPAQLALAFVLAHPNVIAIPKAGSIAHLEENHAARAVALSPETAAQLDAFFPPPGAKRPLEML
ncbi:aldo/keto reductase [Faunimonas sp. B44]|uniref:aldo/keto reductase n=1 Tax=Faunimonas sp. B44 TaxID=3461493 RepID=UPI0040446B74